MRIVIIGNIAGGKSTLARQLARQLDLPCHDIDKILWRDTNEMASNADYLAAHQQIIDQPAWLFEGLGRRSSVPARVERATHLILIDLPVWQHYWLAAQRQITWMSDASQPTPGDHSTMPPLKAVMRMIHEVDSNWMPQIRQLCEAAQRRGIAVKTVNDLAQLDNIAQWFKS